MPVFKHPVTSVTDRLDEIAAMARGWNLGDYVWPSLESIEWLRSVLDENWGEAFPQPYIGTGPEDGMISLYWKTAAWTFTLEIETVSKTGYLCRAPNQAIGEVELAEDVDLTNGEAWRQIASALGVEVDRAGNILATSLG